MSENNGFTQVPNEFFDLLPDLKPYEKDVYLTICRKTIGWQKESDRISLSQFESYSISGRGRINEAIKSLESRGLILVDRTGYVNSYQLKRDSSPSEPVPSRNHDGSPSEPKQFPLGTKDGSRTEPTKERKYTLTKETITKYTIGDGEKWNGEDPVDYVSFVDKWNELYDTSLRITEKKREQIRARLRTWTGSEILKAWTNRLSDSYLTGEGSEYLTNWKSAMRNDEKVERYQTANEVKAKPKGINLEKLTRQLEQSKGGNR